MQREQAGNDDAIPLFEITFGDGEIENAVDSITRGSYWAKGPYVSTFERELESYLGVEHAITVNSGTSALHCALHAHGVGPGDEVVVPSFTFIATANAVRMTGGRPVFADIERDTYGLDPDDVAAAITDDTVAILPVHCYGGSCKIRELRDVADAHDVALVEDVAEAFGATNDGDLLGTFGDTAAFSFCQNKVLTTGEGGAVVTDDAELARAVRLFRSHGRATDEDYFDSAQTGRYVSVGANYRMSDLVAAVGCAQLENADALVADRIEAIERVHDGLSDVDGVTPHRVDAGRHVYQLNTVTLAPDVDRDGVIRSLDDRGIDAKVYWDPPVHETEAYDDPAFDSPSLPVTDDVSGRVLSLPAYADLDERTADRIVRAVGESVRQHA